MTELEKACDDTVNCINDRQWFRDRGFIDSYDEFNGKTTYQECARKGVEFGFMQALKTEHTKHTEEVKGLVKEIKAQIRKLDDWAKANDIKAFGFEFPLAGIENALKPFEKEGE